MHKLFCGYFYGGAGGALIGCGGPSLIAPLAALAVVGCRRGRRRYLGRFWSATVTPASA
jgi:hypothetical protein